MIFFFFYVIILKFKELNKSEIKISIYKIPIKHF